VYTPSLPTPQQTPNDAPLFDWRVHLPVHPAADAFPKIPHDRLIAIGEDIKANGLHFPIIVQRKFGCRPGNASFSVLDGRSRLDAMVAVGIKFEIAHIHRYDGPTIETQDDGPIVDVQVVELHPDQIAAFVLSVNLHRRHLDAEGKRAAIDVLLKLDPGKSDRQIAQQTGSSPTTVGKQRKKAESAGDVSKMDTRTDTKGREQPAKRKGKAGKKSNSVAKSNSATVTPAPIEAATDAETKAEVETKVTAAAPEASAEPVDRKKIIKLAGQARALLKHPTPSNIENVKGLLTKITRLCTKPFIKIVRAPEEKKPGSKIDYAKDILGIEGNKAVIPADLSIPDILKRTPDEVTS
jgi:hypothetical protein